MPRFKYSPYYMCVKGEKLLGNYGSWSESERCGGGGVYCSRGLVAAVHARARTPKKFGREKGHKMRKMHHQLSPWLPWANYVVVHSLTSILCIHARIICSVTQTILSLILTIFSRKFFSLLFQVSGLFLPLIRAKSAPPPLEKSTFRKWFIPD